MTDPGHGAVGLNDQRAAVYDAAHREWHRLGGLSREARLTLVADTVWRNAYRVGYGNGAARVAEQVRLIATKAASSLPPDGTESERARRALGSLVTATRQPPSASSTLPTAVDTLAAVLASTAVPATHGADRRAADITWPDALRAGGAAGIVSTAADILVEWRRLLGATELAQTHIHGQRIVDWVDNTLRLVTHHAAAGQAWSTTTHSEWVTRMNDRAAGAKAPAAAQQTVRVSQGFPRLAVIAGGAQTSSTTASRSNASSLAPQAPGRGRGSGRSQ